tara:strand:+ start:52 stop:1662 length:1611 start_codon:yes stop_codon:yes gene_type:complete
MEIGFDPIGLDKIKVSEWLKKDKDNIVIYLDESVKNSERILLLNKSYFLNPNMKDIYKACIVKNGALMVKDTYKSTVYYRNIGFYLDKYNMIDNTHFIHALKKSRTFTLKKLESKFIDSEFINEQLLELSQIGLKPDKTTHDNIFIKPKTIETVYPKTHPPQNTKFVVTDINTGEKHGGVIFPEGVSDDNLGKPIRIEVYTKEYKKNIEHKEEVYFDQVIADALYDYSYRWDSPINNYLRLGDSYFNSPTYKGYYPRYIDKELWDTEENMRKFIEGYMELKIKYKDKKLLTLFNQDALKYMKYYRDLEKENLEISIKNVKEHITNIDKCFMKYAPRVSNAMSKNVYWRGMDRTYEGQNGVNSEFIVKNFQSISSNIDIAERFSGPDCCMFKIKLQTGLPYINMINTTQFKHESEILLPRNVKFKITKESHQMIDGVKKRVYDIEVSMINKDQFKLDTGCDKYNQCIIIPQKPVKNMTKISKQLDTDLHNSKLPTKLSKETVKTKTIKKCNYRKNKDPKCNDQSGCEWVVNKGCLNK